MVEAEVSVPSPQDVMTEEIVRQSVIRAVVALTETEMKAEVKSRSSKV